jgi:hypothetical protein
MPDAGRERVVTWIDRPCTRCGKTVHPAWERWCSGCGEEVPEANLGAPVETPARPRQIPEGPVVARLGRFEISRTAATVAFYADAVFTAVVGARVSRDTMIVVTLVIFASLPAVLIGSRLLGLHQLSRQNFQWLALYFVVYFVLV